MEYPTLERVEAADREQLCEWYRYLSSPGWDSTEEPYAVFRARMEREKLILDRIIERFTDAGGFTPEISKKLGWHTPAKGD